MIKCLDKINSKIKEIKITLMEEELTSDTVLFLNECPTSETVDISKEEDLNPEPTGNGQKDNFSLPTD